MYSKSQNSGVLVKGEENARNLDYFGILTNIIKLSYFGGNNVVLFKCDWWDVSSKKGYWIDKYGFFLLNSNRKLRTNEPYVLASQAQQVYYVIDIKDLNWLVVVRIKPRDLYDVSEKVTREACQENDDIDSIPFTSNALDNDRGLSLDMNDLARPIFDGKSMVLSEVVDHEEESDDEIIDLEKNKENDYIDEANNSYDVY